MTVFLTFVEGLGEQQVSQELSKSSLEGAFIDALK
jgi:hypothetical protein